jgi:hypothetical protein
MPGERACPPRRVRVRGEVVSPLEQYITFGETENLLGEVERWWRRRKR